MPRNLNGFKGNRTDTLVPRPQATAPGQPNGKPVTAKIPGGLPYGEKGALQQALANTPSAPKFSGRPMPVAPSSTDFSHPDNWDQLQQALDGWTPNPVTPLTAPTERPDEHPMTGTIGRPDSIISPAPPGNIAELLQQVSMATGSASLSSLAMRAQQAAV